MGPGTHIGHYRLTRVLGTGSFATVWLAQDEHLDAPVAVKLLADNWASNADVRRRFIEEARLLRRMDDDRLVRVYSVDELDDGRPYFVMAFADRGTLQDRIAARGAGRGWPLGEVVAVVTAIADCLSAVHSYGVVHRDVKPSNVLFRSLASHLRAPGREERVVLADFGLAKDTLVGSGFTLAAGTPAYMAPEQAQASAVLDMRADVFSLAAILYELLTGSPAYASGTLSAARAGQRPGPRPLQAVRPDLPPALQSVVDRGLAEDAALRWPSARDLAGALVAAIATPAPPPAGAATVPPRLPTDAPPPPAPRPAVLGPPPSPLPPVHEPVGPAPELTTVVGALIGQAKSVMPSLGGVWDAAATALDRQLVIVATGADFDARVVAGLSSLGDLRTREDLTVAWKEADLVLVGGAAPWPAPALGRPAPRMAGPVRVLAVTREAPGSGEGAGPGELDPAARFTPEDIAGLVAWVIEDARRWAGAVRSGAALDLMEAGLGRGVGPAGDDLAARVELIRLAHPVLADVTILRAEAEGGLRLSGPQRAELRRTLTPASPSARVGLDGPGRPEEIRRIAIERASHWRELVNGGSVPFASRFAAEALARAYDRLASGS